MTGRLRRRRRVWLALEDDDREARLVAEALRVGVAALAARDPFGAVDTALAPANHEIVRRVIDDIDRQMVANRAPAPRPAKRGQRRRPRRPRNAPAA